MLEIMKNSILKWGGTKTDASKLRSLIENVGVSKERLCPLVYIPFSDETDFSHEPILTIIGFERTERLIGIEPLNDRLQEIEITMGLARTKAVFMVGLKVCSDGGPEKPPFARCYCSRDNGTGTTQGSCTEGRNDEHCGKCGRAGLKGRCSGAQCPGC